MIEPIDESNTTIQVNTTGGAYIEGNVKANEFVGRDQHVYGDEVYGSKITSGNISNSEAIAIGNGAVATSVKNFFLGIPKSLVIIIVATLFILAFTTIANTFFTAGILRVVTVPPTPTFTPIPTATPSPAQCGIWTISVMREVPETGKVVNMLYPGEIVVIKALHISNLSSDWFQVELNRGGKVYEGFITSHPLNPCVLTMR